MNPGTFAEAKKLFAGIDKQTSKASRVTTIIAPPYLYIARLKGKHVSLASQDMFYEEKGSFTGKISAAMLLDAGIKYVIIGHSESRKLGDTNQSVNKKVHAALKTELTPIVCIGEEIRNDDGHHLEFLRAQVTESLWGVSKKQMEKVIIAYEPVWAIGGAIAMSPHDVHEMYLFIQKVLRETWKGVSASTVPVLYGGAVDPTNAAAIVNEGQVDGLLVGRQSLVVESFASIISILNEL